MANKTNYKKKGKSKHTGSSSAKKKNQSRQTSNVKRSTQTLVKKAKAVPQPEVKPSVQGDILSIILFAVSVFFFFLTIVEGENVWFDIHSFILGIFGDFSILWAVFFIYASVRAAYKVKGESNVKRFCCIMAGLMLLSTFWYVFFDSSIYQDGTTHPSYFEILSASYKDGSQGNGACVSSALFGGLLCVAFGIIGAKISILILIFVFVMILCGYNLDFLYKGGQSISKYLKGEANEGAKFIKDLKKEKSKRSRSVPEKKHTDKKVEGKSGYSFEQFEKTPEKKPTVMLDDDFIPIPAASFKQNQDKTPKSNGNLNVGSKQRIVFFDVDDDEDDIKIEEIADKIEYDQDESYKNIKNLLGIEEFEDEKEFFDEYDSFELDEIFDRRDLVKKNQTETESVEEDAEYLTETDNSEHNAEAVNDDPFKIMGVTAGEEAEENVDYYRYPPISLLSKPSDDSAMGITPELRANGELLVQTLKSFGVSTRIVNICRGPAITRYELQPSAGVKISKITNLADDIALNLAASAVRIEAPIPGKPAVGIEIPNKKVSVVKAREIIDTNEFNVAQSKLTVALGKDINGDAAFADLSKMPHLLIAGATGSGKSVCINSIIVSLLYKASPDEVKLLMIDPKVVELGVYNGIPHLLVPVVTDPKKAAGALAWAVTEMLKRYNTFADNNVRDIFGYNAYAEQNNLKKLEQIVIIIDELADLMMVAAKEVEDSVCRLAQMARAAGMYLIIATQRPSVDIITGVIKANIPSRIAFAVSSQVDSRTILDSGGAEKLIGRGDMLFVPMGASKPKRIQGCFISDKEIEQIAEFVKNSHTVEYNEEVSSEIDRQAELAIKPKKGKGSDDDGGGFDFEDEVLMQAIEYVIDAGQASTSMLQRRLRVGYARAGRLIDEMENMGIVGPHEGSKPRTVLMTKPQFLEMKMRKNDNSKA